MPGCDSRDHGGFLQTRGQADVGLNRPGLRKVRAGARWFVLRVCVGSGAVRQGCFHQKKHTVVVKNESGDWL